MNRFRLLLSGAAILATSAGSLSGQVPVVQPPEIVLRAPDSSGIPVVTSGNVPLVSASTIGNKAVLKTGLETNAPASDGPLQPLVPKAANAVPPIIRSQTTAENPADAFSPKVMADHPDVSLPTEIPIVKNGAAVKGRSFQSGGANSTSQSEKSDAAVPVVAIPNKQLPGFRVRTNTPPVIVKPLNEIPVVRPPNAEVSSSGESPRQTTAASEKSQAVVPVVAIPQEVRSDIQAGIDSVPVLNPLTEIPVIKQPTPLIGNSVGLQSNSIPPTQAIELAVPVVASPRSELPAVRVEINSIPVLKPAGFSTNSNGYSTSDSPVASRGVQEPVAPGVERPGIALPPIRAGEEFPRSSKEPNTGKSPFKPAVTGSVNSGMSFESIPVGTGTSASQIGVQTQLSEPAAPVLEQDLSRPVVSVESEQLRDNSSQTSENNPQFAEPELGLPASGEQTSEGVVGNSYLNEEARSECHHCGGAGCSHCGLGGWNSLGNRSMINLAGNCDNGCFGLLPCAQNYFIGDVLYWTRNGGNVTGTDFGGVYDYDWNFGTQFTMGTRVDPLYGHELSYFGLFNLDAGHTDLSAAGDIDALFTPGDGLSFADTSAFFDAVETTQTATSSLNSFQVNRVRLGWDVVQSHLGLRYIRFDDQYLLQSRNLSGDTGQLSVDANNNLIGPEVGIKLFYDVGRRISFSTHWKLGGYLNAYKGSTFLQNNGLTQVNNSDSGTGFAASLDLGANAHIHLTERLRLRGGYGVLWLWDVASVTRNYPSFLTPSSGTSTNHSEDVIFHGTNVGFEYYW